VSIDIKTAAVEPIRHTFDNVRRRQGGVDKPASRYLEATWDVQPTVHFHYRPLWQPQYRLYDSARTAIGMQDWYALLDPRQYYYGAYVMARARQQENAENNFAFVERRDLVSDIEPRWRERILDVLLPLRHVEWGANTNNCAIADFGYGTAMTQAAIFNTMDRLGIAQYLSRIGLMFDASTGDSLEAARTAWLEGPLWQPLRRHVENCFVIEDWFELHVAQNFALDGLLFPLVYDRFVAALGANGGAALAMLTEFMLEWFAENGRWVDATVKRAAAESDANRDLIGAWVGQYTRAAHDALAPIAGHAFGEQGAAVLDELAEAQRARAEKAGLSPAVED